jgi:hypothetical protein
VNQLQLALGRAQRRLLERLEQLEERIADEHEDAWPEYRDLATALAAVAAQLAPGARGELLTTEQMAARLGISSKTLLRRRARGQVKAPVQLGQRGRAALRWRGDEVAAR